MKSERPEIFAASFGLASVIFFAKGLLAIFWQKIPCMGWFWILMGVTAAIGCGWACMKARKRK